MESNPAPNAGNRGKGRPRGSTNKATAELKKYAQKYTKRAISRLAYLSEKAKSEQAQVAACNALLDRGHGKAIQAVEMSGPDGSAIPVSLEVDL